MLQVRSGIYVERFCMPDIEDNRAGSADRIPGRHQRTANAGQRFADRGRAEGARVFVRLEYLLDVWAEVLEVEEQ